MTSRIALIHATSLAIEPIRSAFAQMWPEAQLMNFLDDSLTGDLARNGALDVAMMERFEWLCRYAAATGADAVLFTCSAFGAAIENAGRQSGIPILKPNEAMFAQALDAARAGSKTLGLVTTFAPAAASMREELLAEARLRGIVLTLHEACVAEAMPALNAGDPERHGALIAAAASALPPCDAIMLGQFSMARCAAAIGAIVPSPVLTSPHSAVASLQARLRGSAGN